MLVKQHAKYFIAFHAIFEQTFRFGKKINDMFFLKKTNIQFDETIRNLEIEKKCFLLTFLPFKIVSDRI